MISDRKCKLMLFVDYLLTLLLCVFGLFILSWLLNYSWGYIAYSVLFTLIFFGLVYSRCWNKAKSDLKYQKETVKLTNALRMVAPLTIFFLVIAALFALIKFNIIPIRDIVTEVRYVLEENQPRQVHNIVLFDTVVPIIRILFSFLIGFQPADSTSALTLLIAPAVTVLAGVLGYLAGMRKFYISEVIIKTQQKAKDKFNE